MRLRSSGVNDFSHEFIERHTGIIEIVAANVRRARKQAGLSQEQLIGERRFGRFRLWRLGGSSIEEQMQVRAFRRAGSARSHLCEKPSGTTTIRTMRAPALWASAATPLAYVARGSS